MSTPFASKLFENSSNNTDGWDEWDWVDNNNTSNVSKVQKHQQLTQQSAQTAFSIPQTVQPAVTDNAANYFNPVAHITLPTNDQAIPSDPSNAQFTATLSNNNHLDSGVYQDTTNFQHHTTFINNNQTANNNFLQSTSPNYHHIPTSSESMQNENHDISTLSVPSRTPQTEYSANDQHATQNTQTDSEMPAISSARVQNLHSTTLLEAASASSVPVFSINSALPSVFPPPSLIQTPFANTNPFKRVGSHAHRTPPPPPVANLTPDIFNNPQRKFSQDINEPITHNDRNEYLQTGHLSEDGENNLNVTNNDAELQYSSSDGNGENLPPPGLSRLVLGEQETNESKNTQPPPGLNRLVTGTEINQSDISLERQADGQDNADISILQVIRNNNQFSGVQTQPIISSLPSSHSNGNQSYENNCYEILESDRNQYLVAGENVVDNTNNVTTPAQISPNTNIERVVTGLENIENQDNSLPERQRELNMDGENIEDEQQQQQQQKQQQHQTQSRFVNASNTLPQIESVEDLDTSGNHKQKIQSDPSTGDDSDLEKTFFSRNKVRTNKRAEDRRKKRDDSRYETEDSDHSIRERRRPKENDRFVDKERGHRGRSADIDENDSRAHRDRGEKQYRGDKQYRPPSRDDDDQGRYR